jgi:hypothetical protein
LVWSHAKAQPTTEVVIEEEKEQAAREAGGTADEGERIPGIVNRWREDEEAVLIDNFLDDSDEEGDLVPAEWRQPRFSECSAVLQNSAGSEKLLPSDSVTFSKIQKNSLKTGKI